MNVLSESLGDSRPTGSSGFNCAVMLLPTGTKGPASGTAGWRAPDAVRHPDGFRVHGTWSPLFHWSSHRLTQST